MRYGITLPTSGVPLSRMGGWIRAAADSGYTDLWLGESFGADAVALLALASVVAPQMHLGTAVLPTSTRTPGLLAQSAATLAGLAPGRASVGLGASSPVVVADGGGRALTAGSLAHTRDVVRFLRRALAGERVTESYAAFAVRNFALAEPPANAPPLLVAGLRPAMLRMAAEEADGAVLTLVSAVDVTRIRGVVGELPLVAWLLVCPYDNPAEAGRARHAARRLLAGYLTVPAYSAAADWHGRGDELGPMRSEWAAGRRREAVAAIPDSVVDDLVIHGAPGYCRERIAEFAEAGVQVPLLSAIPLDTSYLTPLRQLAPS